MKLNTVNVIEYEGHTIQQVVAFHNNPEGKEEARKLFAMILREHGAKGIEIDIALEDNNWDSGDGYQVFLTHST
ncbi:MAG: hypothetical protein WC455_09085 [Dehalococcoidia bacterium]